MSAPDVPNHVWSRPEGAGVMGIVRVVARACRPAGSPLPRERAAPLPRGSARGEGLAFWLLAGAACTAAGEFEPTLVGGSAGAAGSGAASAPGQAPVDSPPTPVLDPGEVDAPAALLPGDVVDDGAGATSAASEQERELARDAGFDASDAATDAGASELDAGAPVSDAGAPEAPDASPPDPIEPPEAEPDAGPPSEPCPGLVFEAACYEFFDEQLGWSEAEARCVAWGGHLASVDSPEEDAFLGAWPALLGVPWLEGSGLWLGGTDAVADGDFRWWDGRPLSVAAWAPGQPDNGAGLDCIEKRNDSTQRWYDKRCSDRLRYACERPQ